MNDRFELSVIPVHYPEGVVVDSRQCGVAFGNTVVDGIHMGNAFRIPHGLTKVCITDLSPQDDHDLAEHWFVTTDPIRTLQELRTATLYPISVKIQHRLHASNALCLSGIRDFLQNHSVSQVKGLEFTKVRLTTDWIDDFVEQFPCKLAWRNSFYDSLFSYCAGTIAVDCARLLPSKSTILDTSTNQRLLYGHPWVYSEIKDGRMDLCDLRADMGDDCSRYAEDLYIHTYVPDDLVTDLLNVAANNVCLERAWAYSDYLSSNDNFGLGNIKYQTALRNIQALHGFVLSEPKVTKFNPPMYQGAEQYVPLTSFSSEVLFLCVELQQLAVPEIEFSYILLHCNGKTILDRINIYRCDYNYNACERIIVDGLKDLFDTELYAWVYEDLSEISVLKTRTDELFLWFKGTTHSFKYYIDLTLAAIVSHEICHFNS